MHELILFDHAFMAPGAAILEIFFPQKSADRGTVWIVTRKTLAVANRLVNQRRVRGFTDLAMTAPAKPCDLLLQKPFVFRNMRVMAGFTFPLGNGLMDHCLGKTIPVVTAETNLVLARGDRG